MKQCANDSMVNNALRVKEIIESDAGECGHGKSVVIHLTTALRQFPLTQRSVLMLKYCLTSASSVLSEAIGRMTQSIQNGKPTTNARSTKQGVLAVWRQLVL